MSNEGGAAAPRRAPGRKAPIFALFLVVALPFIGRSVTTIDGAEVVSETLGVFVQGSFGLARIPPADATTVETYMPDHSKYGLFPSLLPLPALAAAWPVRRLIRTGGLEVATALTWSLGTLLAGLAFGALVRAIRPASSGPWEASFVAGTFLWPYAAESFVEPFAAAGIAAGAALFLSGRSKAAAAACWAAACLLKPVLWITVPVFVLVLALDARRPRAAAGALRAAGVFVLALCLYAGANWLLFGSFTESGYGNEALRFTTPLGQGLPGLLLSPGRGLFLYAPAALLGLAGLSRAPRPAVFLCAGAPLLYLLVVARWWSWEGGSAWGPRHLLPVLPLVVAPAVLVAAGPVRAAFVVGALINLPGVLVSPGSWDAYAESLRPPADAAWPQPGSIRVSTLPLLSPVLGHAWLAARSLVGIETARPWLAGGVEEGGPPPDAAASVSPWLLRRVLGLPSIPPMIPRLLVRCGAGHLARGEESKSLPWLREALRLAPGDPNAMQLLAFAERQSRGAPIR